MSAPGDVQPDVTFPVCPACRTGITVNTHVCSRCGLAVRPTCASCGEPLDARMHACPRCWEVIEHPIPVSEGSLVYEATGTENVAGVVAAQEPEHMVQIVTLPTEAVTSTPRQWDRSKTRIRVGRLMLIGLFAGLLVAAGLLALEAVVPRLRGTQPDQIKLVRESFLDLDVAIGVPDGWDVRPEDVDAKPGVVAFEPVGSGDDDDLRRLNIVRVDRSFDKARDLAGTRAPASARNYEEIDITDGLQVDNRRAFRHRYTDGDEYREEWWIETSGNQTYRVEFVSPLPRREESAILFVRIARSFDVL